MRTEEGKTIISGYQYLVNLILNFCENIAEDENTHTCIRMLT